jgi:hypothetical protein
MTNKDLEGLRAVVVKSTMENLTAGDKEGAKLIYMAAFAELLLEIALRLSERNAK